MDSKEEATATSGNVTLEIPASVPSYVIISEQIPKANGEGTGQHGGRREYLWSDEATEKLVMMVKENYAKVIGGRDAREEVFREITKKLVEYSFPDSRHHNQTSSHEMEEPKTEIQEIRTKEIQR